jgi:hypothetical protein
MSIKKKAAQSREWVRDWMEDPYNYVLKRMVSHQGLSIHAYLSQKAEGTARSSMVLDALKRTGTEDPSVESSQTIKESAATAFAGEHRSDTVY